ncbi:type IX secretion system sortase PorU [Fulvivirgaceae bacterium BMA12]|uniref:Type IX secretion system sortase PorU n=1 Tax=Agaribacillus aureus TaxID=3051825 RepID=A0ABT8LEZ8_9BACT|nr:type IX secretion system sortase PorU [Fulvivirgaceae bacterium BMA12]
MTFLLKRFFFLLSLIPCILWAQEPVMTSVLSTGSWYQFKIHKSGVYRIDYDQLQNIGIDVDGINPCEIKIYGGPGAMLPQANGAARPQDLAEHTILVAGEEDGRFDENDYILFYGEGAGSIKFDLEERSIEVEPHLYDRHNYYYLTISRKTGLRVESQTAAKEDTENVITYFDDYYFHKQSLKNLLASGRKWYGEEMSEGEAIAFQLPIQHLNSTGKARLQAAVLSTSKKNSQFDFSLNNVKIGDIKTKKVAFYAYGRQAEENEGVIEFDANLLLPVDKLSNLEIAFDDLGGDAGYLDYFLLNFQRKLVMTDNQLIFRSFASAGFPISNFRIDGMDANMKVWDISNPRLIAELPVAISGDQGNVITNTGELKEMIAFDPLLLPPPDFKGRVQNQNLHGMQTPDFLILTTAEFMDQATRLADFRTSNGGLQTAVVDIATVYHEFSSGQKDITALRDFIRHLHLKSGRLKYLLLFGDASYDYLSANSENTNFVPTYQSRNSLHNVFTYASDDYFTFMDDSEGDWLETNSYFKIQHDLDIGVGRLPVKTSEEATTIVDKLIQYAEKEFNDHAWRNKVVFVADDGEANKFQHQSDYLASQIENNDPEYVVDRLFVDSYPIENKNGKRAAPRAREKINQHINEGVLIFDFIGHGGETALTNEGLVDLESIDVWENENRLPVILTATCEFGRYDDWDLESGAEKALFKKNGGAIALLTTSRPAIVNTNFDVSKAFYESAFNNTGPATARLGDILRETKNKSVFGIVNRSFVLLGDPSMQLAYPQYDVVITSVNDKPEIDTLQSFSDISLVGEIRKGASLLSDFNGVLNISFYDQKTNLTTIGNGSNRPMDYQNWDDLLVKGSVSVKDGRFQANFTIPGGAEEALKTGKMVLYAYEESSGRDASGSYNNIKIRHSQDMSGNDHRGPEIDLSIDFEDFENGGIVGNNILVLARLKDKNGINLSANPENGIVAYLNGNTEDKILLSRFYQSELDDFTSGRLAYLISDLTPNQHTLTVEASDNFNNRSSRTINFTVAAEDFTLLQRFTAYPNPATNLVNFEFSYKNAPEDLLGILLIYSSRGELVKVVEKNFTDHSLGKQIIQWDRTNARGQVARPGLYFYDFYLRSLLNSDANKKGKILIH